MYIIFIGIKIFHKYRICIRKYQSILEQKIPLSIYISNLQSLKYPCAFHVLLKEKTRKYLGMFNVEACKNNRGK